MGEGKKYRAVQRIGGAGDAGRDVEARYTEDLKADEWDYQAKRYSTNLMSSICSLNASLVKCAKCSNFMPGYFFVS